MFIMICFKLKWNISYFGVFNFGYFHTNTYLFESERLVTPPPYKCSQQTNCIFTFLPCLSVLSLPFSCSLFCVRPIPTARSTRGILAPTAASLSSPAQAWPQFMNRPMTRADMGRMRGALMGYNGLDVPMALWPEARWGKLNCVHCVCVL